MALAGAAVAAALAAWTPPADARVTRIVINSTVDPDATLAPVGAAGPLKRIKGIAFGELDPADPLNAIIQDINLAPKNAAGKVEYQATFQIVAPSDPAKMSGLMWHDVPNRGGRITIVPAERNAGDVGLSSGWQGDNSGTTSQTLTTNDFVVVPIAKNPDGSTITGTVLGRIVNRSGANSQPILVQNNPLPYKPATLDTTQATLTTHTHETVDGVVTVGSTIPSTDWAWAKCDATHPFPGTPDPTQICLKDGFDKTLLYQVVFTAKDPYVLGIGFAAFRDVASFFHNATADDVGTPNPLAGSIRWVIARGVSQSGNYLRQFLHLGFNEDEAGRQVYDGLWAIIAGRRIALNFRWAQPDGVLELYQAGSEGPQWWATYPDRVRGLPPRGILDRCRASNTCPKIIEHFGSAEVWALKMTPEWVGTDGEHDIPLPKNVRRYYIPSTTHGGGAGGFNTSLPGVGLPTTGPNCPGNNFGTGVLPANPVPHTQTVNALRVHFRNWVMNGTLPPDSMWPRLVNPDTHAPGGLTPDLVDATKEAMGFPSIPGIPAGIPSNFIMPVLDYDWGAQFNYSDTSGVPTNLPPPIKRVIRMRVPRVDADGNEIGGVPVVLLGAPLGTYLGWNITAGGARPFHQGQICDYVGGMVPFAKTQAERLTAGDPRLSLEERYGTHDGYVAAVQAAAANAVAKGFLLQEDADALIAQAQASAVLNP
ncbi:MAG TPA: alpha/beta hydrolase domain-containing protein [Gemmatimonadales bacterium]|nr:alpha/beta hydrolase domain-containing protein [Usitatibacter sp.]